MRNLTEAEKQKLYAELKKEIERMSANQASWTSSSGSFHNPQFPGMNMSPTDVDAKGKFPYQEPEVDEQGTYYGYKVLMWDEKYSRLRSPRYPVSWTLDGELHADREPSERSMYGIHFTKRPDHDELRYYLGGRIPYTPDWGNQDRLLVKCALSGTIVETEQGFRAEHAQIIGVFYDGNWTSYQDYQERAYRHSNPIAEYRWEESEYWNISYGKPPKGIGPINPVADS